MLNIYFFALRCRQSGILTAFVYNVTDDTSIRDFYLRLLKETDFSQAKINVLEYDVVKLGYYDVMKRNFVNDDNVLFSVTADMLKEVKVDEV